MIARCLQRVPQLSATANHLPKLVNTRQIIAAVADAAADVGDDDDDYDDDDERLWFVNARPDRPLARFPFALYQYCNRPLIS